MTSHDQHRCPRCGEKRAAEAALCPKCALLAAVGDEDMGDTGIDPAEAETVTSLDGGDGPARRPAAIEGTSVRNLPASEAAGDAIGPYRLVEKLGEGGFGVVWKADQSEPVRRQVALKVIKPGMDSAEIITRFEAERQALALMDHPGIANVFDAGTTETRRPFFVMELVEGRPVTDYCDAGRLDLRQRLALFREICGAVQHAHQKGVIHRDLKPNNILVTELDGEPAVKVIDFGIAKSVGQGLTEETLFTAQGQLMGTPQYMSPEQADLGAKDVDTRSDIYSLGVVLYELLTGHPPFDRERLRQAGLEEILRMIREEEPPKPSTRLGQLGKEEITTVARAQGGAAERLPRRLRGDLDWIVMKAVEKDRTRRYESASAFSEDIERYLRDEAVLASPPTAAYRLRKFATRNKGLLSAAAVIMATLAGAAAMSTWQAMAAWKAREAEVEQRELAEQREKETRSVLTFFQDRVLAAARPRDQAGGLGIDTTIREALDAAEPEVSEAFPSRPLTEASVRMSLGLTYLYLGEQEGAIRQNEQALEIQRHELGVDHPHTLRTLNNLAAAYRAAGRTGEALKYFQEVVDLRKKLLGAEDPMTLRSMLNLAISYSDAKRHDESSALREQTLVLMKRVLGPEHPDTLLAMNNLAISWNSAGRIDDALELHEKVMSLRQKILGPEHPDTFQSVNNVAVLYLEKGLYRKGLKMVEEVVDQRKEVLGSDHPDTLRSMAGLAAYLGRARRWEEAIEINRTIVESRKSNQGADHPDTIQSMDTLAACYSSAGEHEEAVAMSRETLALLEEIHGADHPKTLRLTSRLALSLWNADRIEEALATLEATVELREKVLGPEHRDTLGSLINLATFYSDAGRHGEAVALKKQTLETCRRVLGPEDPVTLTSLHNLAVSYRDIDRIEDATRLAEQAYASRKQTLGPIHPETLSSLRTLGVLHSEAGKFDRAIALRSEAVEIREEHLGPEHPKTLDSMGALASLFRKVGRHEESATLKEKTLASRRKVLGDDHPDTLRSMHNLANSYTDLERHDEAAALWESIFTHRNQSPGPDHPKTLEALSALAFSCLEAGRLEESESHHRRFLTASEKQQASGWKFYYAQSTLGLVLTRQQRYSEAEPLLLAGHRGLEALAPKDEPEWLRFSATRLVKLYREWGKEAEGSEWQSVLDSLKGIGNAGH